jgi:Tol biopolymer transport system component
MKLRPSIFAPTAITLLVLVAAAGAANPAPAGAEHTTVRLQLAAAAGRAGVKSYSGTIAFLRDGAGLDVIQADGSGLKRLTPPGMTIDAYAWSPNGHSIAFIDDEHHSLWLVRPNGTGLRKLLAGPSFLNDDLTWSPNGTEIASTSPTRPQTACDGKIYIVPIDGSRPRVIPGLTACGVAWSPHGQEIAFWGNGSGIWAVHPDGTGRQQVSSRGWGWVRWSSDAKQLAFGLEVGYVQGLGLYRGIAVVDANGQHFHVVTRNADNEYPAAWSPRGRRILYGRANGAGINVIGANGQNDHRITSDSPPGSDWPALGWSPDGGSIVYANQTSNGSDLYEVGIDGHRKVELTNPPNNDIAPSWVTG